MPDSADNASARKLVLGLTAALAAWAVFLAVGIYLTYHSVLRAMMPIACMALFLGLWWLGLALHRSRAARRQTSAHKQTSAGKTSDGAEQ
jgi:hypothetical protein